MEVKVVLDYDMPTHLTGGEYATNEVTVYVDPDLSGRTQVGLVTHAVIECYCPSWEHTKVEELTELIQDAIDQLRGQNEQNIVPDTMN